MITEINDSNFKQKLAEGKPLVVDFWAPWCGPCKMMLPVFEELSNELDGKIDFAKVNVDENDALCADFGIMNIPTMLLFKNGELVGRHVGACRKADLDQLLREKLL